MIDTMKSGLEWAQGLTFFPKLGLSVAISAAALAFLIAIWQKPPPNAVEPSLPLSINQSSTDGADTAQIATTGDHSPAIGQHNSGGINVAGDNTGVIAGTYYAAPATAAERAQQGSRLKQELGDFANYPDKFEGKPRTILETHSTTGQPLALYSILSRYYKTTISDVPDVGADLLKFKRDYYTFSGSEAQFEQRAILKVGTLVEGRLRPAWEIYFYYFLLRSAEHSIDAVKAGGNFLNYGITWEDAERVYQALNTDAEISGGMKRNLAQISELQRSTGGLIANIKKLDF
ncbi:hypothetical protein ACLIMP_08720 [Novosphingobium aerophilum]|uniref:hypothetical protein n=1 Tax=Novosphingobium TaxID=165696 RepID=UPI002D77F615|nr:hypothetical protein [Novosphingobium sp. RL4]WRT94343.1 hypothetical protein U9J33_07545 [Novosphingobium sp. RL4]